MLHHLALDDGGNDVAQGRVLLERGFTGLEVRTRLQRSDAGNECPRIDVGHAFPVQRLGDVALAGALRDVDDLVFLQRSRRLEHLSAVIVHAARTDHRNQQEGDDGVADNHEGIARAVRSLRRRRDLLGLERCPRTPGRNGRPFTHRSNLNPAGSNATRQSLVWPSTRAHLYDYRRIRQNGGFVATTNYWTRRRTITDALVPPKPKEFDNATLTSRFFAICGTRSIAVSTDGLSRLMVGGTTLSRIARMAKIASIAPAAPSRWPVEDLVEDIATLEAALPSRRSTAPSSISSPSGVEVPCALI